MIPGLRRVTGKEWESDKTNKHSNLMRAPATYTLGRTFIQF